MPQAVFFAVAGAVGGSAAVGVAAGYVAMAATYAAGMYLLNKATAALTPGAPRREGGGIELNYSGTDERRRIIYGSLEVGGMQTIPPITTGNEGRHLHLVLTLAGHEIDSIVYVRFDKDIINDGQIGAVTGTDDDGVVGGGNKYTDKAWIRRYYGTAAQTADYILTQAYPSAFDSNFRGRGIPYLAVRLRYGEIYSGLPNISAYVKGKKCYDPRSSTTVWTSNPAIIARDYLLTDGGYDSDDIDDASVIAAANICDQTVAIPPSSTQKRYTCNLLLEAATTPQDFERNLKMIVDTMRGRVVQRDGRWFLYAGAWDVPSVTIAQADWIGATVVRASQPPEERWNAVRVWYIDPNREWQRVECYPRRNTTYETDDGGDRMWLELELTGVTSEYAAQRHGEFALRASRNQTTITGRLRPEFFKLATWDTVSVTDTEYGWSSKGFRVAAMDLTPTGECDVTLVEEGSALWTDLAEGEYNAVTTWATIDPGASVPQARTNVYITAQPAAIGFSWDKPTEPIPGEQTRLMEGTSNLLTSAAEVWRGDSTGVILHKTSGDVTTRYYWVQGVVGSYTGWFTPNSFGTAIGALPWTQGAMVAQLSLPSVSLPALIDGTVTDYSPAQGNVLVHVGGLDVTTYAAISATSQAGCVGAANSADNLPVTGQPKGHYRVTNVTSDVGMLWITAVYSASTHLLPFVVTKQKSGATGPIGPPGSTIVSNGMMNHVNSATGMLAGWTNGLAHPTAGIDGGPCLWIPNSPAYSSIEHEEFIPVDMTRERLQVEVRVTQTVSGGRYLYLGLACYDKYYQYLGYHHESWLMVARTILPSSLNQLFTWKPSSVDAYYAPNGYPVLPVAIMPYDGIFYMPSSLVHMDRQYDRQILSINTTASTSHDILTVSSDWGGSPIPADYYFPVGQLGGTHKYLYYNYPAHTGWQTIAGTVPGESTPYRRHRSDMDELWTLRHRTKYVRPYLLASPGVGDVYVDNFNLQRELRADDDEYAGDGRLDASGRWDWNWNNVNSYSTPVPVAFQPNSGASGGGAIKFAVASYAGGWVAGIKPKLSSVGSSWNIIKPWGTNANIRFKVTLKLWRHPSNTNGTIRLYFGTGDYVQDIDVTKFTTGKWYDIARYFMPTGYIDNVGYLNLAVQYTSPIQGGPVLVSDIDVVQTDAPEIPFQSTKSAEYTLQAIDVGRSISTAFTVNLPTDQSIPVGSWIRVYNNSGSTISVNPNGNTLRLGGTSTTGTRSIPLYGVAILTLVGTTEWVITGTAT